MDTTDSHIEFDHEGVCDHCRNFYDNILPTWQKGKGRKDEVNEILADIKRAGRDREFDCILGVSGGADSSYLTHLAKEEFELRPLVFHVDAGWNSQIAVNNIEQLVEHLNLDLYTQVINWQEMRDLQLAFFKASVPHIDIPQDHAFFATMYNFAEEYDVKYILTGANHSTECVRNPVEWIYYGSDVRQLKAIHREFGERPLDDYPLSNVLNHKFYQPYIRGIKVVKPLNYVPYVKKEAMAFLSDRYGWEAYPQKHFESRFTRFYEGFWLPRKFGYDTRKVQFSSLILTDQMARDEALEELRHPPYDQDVAVQDFEYVATKLGIGVDKLQSYMDAPNRSYKDFDHQRILYTLGIKILKLLGVLSASKR